MDRSKSNKRFSFNGTPTLAIPYLDEDENPINTRYRIAIDGPDKFRWKTGSKVIPYGLWKLLEAREAGYVVLAEGESDCHTLWYKKFPAGISRLRGALNKADSWYGLSCFFASRTGGNSGWRR